MKRTTPLVVSSKVASVASSVKNVLGGKRKAAERSPEPIDLTVATPAPLSSDIRPLKKHSSSSLLLRTDSPTASFGMPPPSSHSASLYDSAASISDPLHLVSISRLNHQLHASREDLNRERQARDVDCMLYEQEIAVLKEQVTRSSDWKGKGRE